MSSIGMACNFYREPHALPGLLECAQHFFDDMVFVSTPPAGAEPDHESIAIIEKFGARLRFDTIDKGFGAIRTRLIGETKTDWTIISDADERWFLEEPLLKCHGSEHYPEHKNPRLHTTTHGTVRPKELLMRLIDKAENEGCGAVRMSRRHWMGKPGDWSQPCQNWDHERQDWQLRAIKNSPFYFFNPEVKIHERLLDSRTWGEPKWISGDTEHGPFFQHFHVWYKGMDGEQNKEDAAIYEMLDKGVVGKMWLGEHGSVKEVAE